MTGKMSPAVEHDEEPGGETLPLAQSEQDVELALDENLPAGQGSHLDPT